MYLKVIVWPKFLTPSRIVTRAFYNGPTRSNLGRINLFDPGHIRHKLPLCFSVTQRRDFSNFSGDFRPNPLKGPANQSAGSQIFHHHNENGIYCNLFQARRLYRSGRGNRVTKDDDDDSSTNKTRQLMDFPWIIWPTLWNTIRNWIFTYLVIRPYLDQEFTLSSFKSGAIQALVHVSHEISKGNFDGLEGYVTKPSLEVAQSNFAHLSVKQRLDLAIVSEDIFFCFPYQIGVIFTNEDGPKQRIFVEITMCYHVFRGFQDFLENASKPENYGPFKGVYDNHDRISVANYRFIREFTKGVEDDWTVNIANHFKPGEYVKER